MLTTAEKRFLTNWQIQSKGPKWKYYLQYIVAWTAVIFLCLFFLIKLIITDRSMGGLQGFLIIFFVSVVLAYVTTQIVYQTNEKKLKKILEKHPGVNE